MGSNIRYQCCFCGKTIEPTPPDVACIYYTTCIDSSSDMQQSQEMFCHTKCLRSRLDKSSHLYAAFLLEEQLKAATGDEGNLSDHFDWWPVFDRWSNRLDAELDLYDYEENRLTSGAANWARCRPIICSEQWMTWTTRSVHTGQILEPIEVNQITKESKWD